MFAWADIMLEIRSGQVGDEVKVQMSFEEARSP